MIPGRNLDLHGKNEEQQNSNMWAKMENISKISLNYELL